MGYINYTKDGLILYVLFYSLLEVYILGIREKNGVKSSIYGADCFVQIN